MPRIARHAGGDFFPEENEMAEQTEGFKTRQKVEDMILYAHPAITQFPKSEKFALGQVLKETMYAMLGYCVEIEMKKSRKTTLDKLDVETAKLKAFIRIAYDLKFLPPKKYEEWEKRAVEIGKMVGGLLKAEQQNANHRE